MSWNVEDLTPDKLEQSITNEQIRLDNCRTVLDKLKAEYKQKSYMYNVELSNIEDKIIEIESSINGGEEFVRKCNEQLILNNK